MSETDDVLWEWRRIQRVTAGEPAEEEDRVVREAPLTIFFNGREFVTLMCTPEKLDYLALGFLRSEGLIGSYAEVESLIVEESEGRVHVQTRSGTTLLDGLYGRRTITSGCGKGIVFFNVVDSLRSKPVTTNLTVSATQIRQLMDELNRRALLFKATGGCHSAGLGTAEAMLQVFEDIGRHNAVDKLIGYCLLNDIAVNDKILCMTGRLSSEIVLKAAKLQVPVLASRSAPTSLSIELAEALGISMVGFARGRRFNIYARPERILVN